MSEQPSTVKKNYLVEKRNVFNQMRSNDISLQEMRLLSVYLAKINAREPSTRRVRFALEDFQAILGLKKLEMRDLDKAIKNLFTKTVFVPVGESDWPKNFYYIPLFNELKAGCDDGNQRYIEICAHELAMDLMFNFKKKYFTYELWNVIGLKSTNQVRMYELLKEQEYRREWVVDLKDLRALMGIGAGDYAEYNDFKKGVLEVCREALEKHTNIRFTYAPHKKIAPGGTVQSLKFTIEENEGYEEPFDMDELLEMHGIRRESLGGFIEPGGGDISVLEGDLVKISKMARNILRKTFTQNQLMSIRAAARLYFPEDFGGDGDGVGEPLDFKHMNFVKAVFGHVLSRGSSVRSAYAYTSFFLDYDLLFRHGGRDALIAQGRRPGQGAEVAYLKAKAKLEAETSAPAPGPNPAGKRNRFANFPGSGTDYDKLARIEDLMHMAEFAPNPGGPKKARE